MSSADARLEAAQSLLSEADIRPARVIAAGHEREIAAVKTPAHHAAALAGLAPAIKRLGFRYVALDLDTDSERA